MFLDNLANTPEIAGLTLELKADSPNTSAEASAEPPNTSVDVKTESPYISTEAGDATCAKQDTTDGQQVVKEGVCDHCFLKSANLFGAETCIQRAYELIFYLYELRFTWTECTSLYLFMLSPSWFFRH